MLLRVRLSASRKHLRSLELNERPATPGKPVWAAPRAGDPWIINTLPSRRHLTLPWPPASPATPDIPSQTGYWPGSGRVGAHYSSFARTHLHAPYPPQYNVAPGPAAQPPAAYDNTSWRSQQKRWHEVAAHLQRTSLGVYKDTPASLYTGEYPAAYQALRAYRVEFRVQHQFLAPPEKFPATPTTEAIIPAYFAPKQHTRHEKRQRQALPELDSFPRTIQSPAAYAPITTIRRRDTAKILLFPERLDQYTPKTPTPEQPPTAFLAPTTYRRHGKTNIVVLAEFPDRQEAVFPSAIRVAVNADWYWDRYMHRTRYNV